MTFAETARGLAGATAWLFGWRPHEFWQTTPAELAAVVQACAVPEQHADHELLCELMEQFPDG